MRNYNRSQEYKLLNKCAQSNKIVLAGSGIAEELYLNELIEDYDLNQKLYNRSIADLRIEDAVQYFEKCIYELKPMKILIYLGANELTDGNVSVEKFSEQYKWLLYNVHINLPSAQIYIIELRDDIEGAKLYNSELHKIASEYGCILLNLNCLDSDDSMNMIFFRTIKRSFLDKNVSFANAMSISAL